MVNCWDAIAWAAGAAAFALSPGLLLEIPTTDADGKPNGVGFMTGKTNIWAMLVHGLVMYIVMKMIVIPILQRSNEDCANKTVGGAGAFFGAARGGAAPAQQQRYKSHLRRSYVVE